MSNAKLKYVSRNLDYILLITLLYIIMVLLVATIEMNDDLIRLEVFVLIIGVMICLIGIFSFIGLVEIRENTYKTIKNDMLFEKFIKLKHCFSEYESNMRNDEYDRGMYNGIEFAIATLEEREVNYK